MWNGHLEEGDIFLTLISDANKTDTTVKVTKAFARKVMLQTPDFIICGIFLQLQKYAAQSHHLMRFIVDLNASNNFSMTTVVGLNNSVHFPETLFSKHDVQLAGFSWAVSLSCFCLTSIIFLVFIFSSYESILKYGNIPVRLATLDGHQLFTDS